MPITLETATVASLDAVAEEVAAWQQEGGPVQLHPGDIGWNWSFGAAHLAGSVRVWRDDRILAVGLVDDAGLIRMGIAPSVNRDALFATRLLADLSDPVRGVLPEGGGSVELGPARPSDNSSPKAVGLLTSPGHRCVVI